MIRNAIGVIRRLTGRTGAPGLKTVGEIRKVLEVERAVADRTGQCLSVVVFSPRTLEALTATWEVLAKALRARLRVTDEAGWLGYDRVCAVLPFTVAAGAWKVADDVCLLFPEALPPPVCEVYSYPSGDQSPDGRPPSDAGSWDELLGRPGPNGRDSGHRPKVGENGHANGAGHAAARPAAPLEPIFHRHMSLGKRAVDVIGAGAGLLLLAPLLPLVATAIKLSSPGPVFFQQWRAGWGGRPFRMWKFRTMVADAEARKAGLLALNEQDGPAFKIRRDPRVTAVGRLLRATSIDELPQLWNVFKGEMSLVGPRPLPCREADGCEPWQRRRLDVTPGLTCIWQVRGRSAVSFAEWMRMDVEYINTQSLGADLKLILQTVPAMVLRKGAC